MFSVLKQLFSNPETERDSLSAEQAEAVELFERALSEKHELNRQSFKYGSERLAEFLGERPVFPAFVTALGVPGPGGAVFHLVERYCFAVGPGGPIAAAAFCLLREDRHGVISTIISPQSKLCEKLFMELEDKS